MGKIVLVIPLIGLVAGFFAMLDGRMKVLPLALLVGFGVLFFLGSIGGVGFGASQSLPKEVKQINPAVVIENVPGVGISITSDNGKELIVQEYDRGRVAIWKTDKQGKVTGKPLIAQREGEAAYRINEMIR